MQRATLACVAAALALLAAAPLAATRLSQPANEGIPPGFAGLWAEEREGVDGGPSMLLSRQWLPDGNGFVMYTQVRCWGAGVLGLGGRQCRLERQPGPLNRTSTVLSLLRPSDADI